MTRREKLLGKVDRAHDWHEGQVFGRNGNQLVSTDICHICGLRRNYSFDQNTRERCYDFYTVRGEELSLLEASALKSCTK